MLTLSPDTYRLIESMARQRGVTIQELLRAIIIPEWLRKNMDREE
jgi:hypothetical protein